MFIASARSVGTWTCFVINDARTLLTLGSQQDVTGHANDAIWHHFQFPPPVLRAALNDSFSH